jgi:hypothetical protein
VVDVTQAGLVDATSVQKLAAYTAIASAAHALTVDVLIHRQEESGHASVPGPSKRKQL